MAKKEKILIQEEEKVTAGVNETEKFKAFESIGALWKSKTGNGFTGSIELEAFLQHCPDGGKARVFIQSNKYKTSPEHPDLKIFLVKNEEVI